MHTSDGQDVVDYAEDEEEREEAEEVIRSFHGAGAMVGVGGWGGVGEVFEGEEFTVVLDGFGDDYGDDVVDCERGAEELDDEGGWATGATCAVSHEWGCHLGLTGRKE